MTQESDEWYAAVIMGRRDTAVPNTEIILRTYEISYCRVERRVDENDNDDDKELNGQELEPNLESEELELNLEPESNKDVVHIESDGTDGDKSDENVDVTATIPPPPPPPPVFTRSIPPPPPPIFMRSVPMIQDTSITSTNGTAEDDMTAGTGAGTEGTTDTKIKRVRQSRWDTKPDKDEEKDQGPELVVSDSHVAAEIISAEVDGTIVDANSSSQGLGQDVGLGLGQIENQSENEGQNLKQTDDDNSDNIKMDEEKEEELNVETVFISGVRSDHIRLLCTEDGLVFGALGQTLFTVPSLAKAPEPIIIEKSTGRLIFAFIVIEYLIFILMLIQS